MFLKVFVILLIASLASAGSSSYHPSLPSQPSNNNCNMCISVYTSGVPQYLSDCSCNPGESVKHRIIAQTDEIGNPNNPYVPVEGCCVGEIPEEIKVPFWSKWEQIE